MITEYIFKIQVKSNFKMIKAATVVIMKISFNEYKNK